MNRSCTASRAFSTISGSSRSASRAKSTVVAIEDTGVRVRQMQSLKSGQPCQPNDDYEKLSVSRAPDAGSGFAGTPSDFVGIHSRAL